MKRFLSFIPVLLFAGLISTGIVQATGCSMWLAAPAALAFMALLAFLSPVRNAADGNLVAYGIDTQVWLNRLMKLLYKNNDFLMRSDDQSQYVNNITVNIPQEAAGQAWTKNRALGGAATNTTIRTDTVLAYNIDVWTSEPMLVTDAEMKQLSYPKVDAVLEQLIKIGRETIANNMIYNWGATAGSLSNIIRTSGFQNNDQTTVISTSTGLVNTTATGSRKVFGLYDVKQAKKLLDKQNVPQNGRVMLMTPDMYDQLIDDIVVTKYRDASQLMDMKNGAVNRIMGFDIYMRSSVLTYSNAATPVKQAVGASENEDDNDAVLFWQEDHVARAIGENQIYYFANSPTHYGDVMSGLIRMGGSKNLTTERGIGAIVQAAGA